jgi:hypothetical protein
MMNLFLRRIFLNFKSGYFLAALHDLFAPDQTDQDHDYRYNQENMDESSQGVRSNHTEQPKND